MKAFASLLLILITSFVFFSLLYPTTLDAQISAKEKEIEKVVQKFEQIELKDLLKDESLLTEYKKVFVTKIDNFDWVRLVIGSESDIHTRCIGLGIRMKELLEKAAIVKAAEQGIIEARVYLAMDKIKNMLDLAIFRLEFDRFEQIRRQKSWNVSAFGEFIGLYVDVKNKKDFIFFESDSLYRLEREEYETYVDKLNKIALSAVEWVEGLGFDELNPEEKKDFLEKSKEFSKILKI